MIKTSSIALLRFYYLSALLFVTGCGETKLKKNTVIQRHDKTPSLHFDNTEAKVLGFYLVDTSTNQDIKKITDGMIIEESRNLSLRADGNEKVESMKLELLGTGYEKVENYAPFALFGDVSGNYSGWDLSPGEYQIRATGFSEKNASGEASINKTVRFQIVEDNISVEAESLIEQPIQISSTFDSKPDFEEEVIVISKQNNEQEIDNPKPESVEVSQGFSPPNHQFKPFWADSYSVGGKCYCDSTYDHGLDKMSLDINAERLSIQEICERVGSAPLVGKVTYYNDIQCGNGPKNDAEDEAICPGVPKLEGNHYEGEGCFYKGPKWQF